MSSFKHHFLGPFIFGKQINLETFEDYYFFSDVPISRKKTLEITKTGVWKKENSQLEFNEINNNYFRSENFKKDHQDLHVLFSGCSYTFGHGMLENNTWSKVLHNKIQENIKTSGYFNLGTGGASIGECISLIFKYCKTYGNPDVIFLNMPNFNRFYSMDGNIIRFSVLIKDSEKVLSLLAYQYYLMLDLYCKTNNIKLYSFTWSFCENDKYMGIDDSGIKNFDTYHQYDLLDVDNFVKKYLYDNEKAKLLADDNKHLGEPYHQYWADFIYKKYIDDNTRN
jgi:hypothetical protein